MNDWTTSYDKQPKEGTDIIYTDFQKAFDSVQHKRLLHKLSVYGIQGRQSLLSLHMTKSYVRTATHTTLKVEANLTQILNFKANFHTEVEPF